MALRALLATFAAFAVCPAADAYAIFESRSLHSDSALLLNEMQVQDEIEIDKEKIRYGKLADFDPAKNHKVGILVSTDIYEQIPAYQTIVKEKVKRDTARWNKLMKEATQVYKKALAKVAKEHDYVLLIESGGISGYDTTDVTQTVIESLPEDDD